MSESKSRETASTVLVVNADDLGYAEERDRGIAHALSQGIVSSCSMLVNGASAGTAVATLRKTLQADALPIGLHFNMTEGTALATGKEFLGKFGFAYAARAGLIKADEVEAELRAQLKQFQKLVGRLPTHLDGHNHIHVIPVVAGVVAAVCAELGVRWVRMPWEPLDGFNWRSEQQRKFLEAAAADAKEARAVFAKHKLGMTDHFFGMRLMGQDSSLESLCAAIESLPEGSSTEYMVHPGYASKDGDDFSRSKDREHELELLTHSSVVELVKKKGIALRSFGQLGATAVAGAGSSTGGSGGGVAAAASGSDSAAKSAASSSSADGAREESKLCHTEFHYL